MYSIIPIFFGGSGIDFELRTSLTGTPGWIFGSQNQRILVFSLKISAYFHIALEHGLKTHSIAEIFIMFKGILKIF